MGLPLLGIIDLYKKIDWSLTDSFFILTLTYLLAHWFSRLKFFKEVSKNDVENGSR
jgi:hypothetical protein